ncbi:MAG: ABC transporter substrate-binding protein [Pseudomonadota bacterium]
MVLHIRLAAISFALTLVTMPAGARAEDLGVIKDKALEEGALNLAGFSRDRCSFGTIIDSFVSKNPGIAVTELMPEATSEEQLARLRTAGEYPGTEIPDVVQLDYLSGPSAKAEGLLQPYIANNLNELPLPAYDVEYGDRYWSGAYFYVAAMLVNTDAVPNPPKDWVDLLKPDFAGQIALPADPSASPMVALAVLSAGNALAEPGLSAAARGLDHFAAVAAAGNLAKVAGTPETVADGTTPILILSDADALAAREATAGTAALKIVIPMRGATADIHVMAISAAAPHPNAAKLWFEHFYSYISQSELLRGDCNPINWSDLADWDLLPDDLTEGRPSNLIYTVAQFPTYEQRAESTALVAGKWDAMVGAP